MTKFFKSCSEWKKYEVHADGSLNGLSRLEQWKNLQRTSSWLANSTIAIVYPCGGKPWGDAPIHPNSQSLHISTHTQWQRCSLSVPDVPGPRKNLLHTVWADELFSQGVGPKEHFFLGTSWCVAGDDTVRGGAQHTRRDVRPWLAPILGQFWVGKWWLTNGYQWFHGIFSGFWGSLFSLMGIY